LDKDHAKAATEHPAPPIDPRSFGLVKAAYTVNATLDVLSIGRTSLYAAVKQGELHPVKFGRKTLFYAADLAALLAKLRNASQPAGPAKKDGRR
jgi:excisionase family DNA binding protein